MLLIAIHGFRMPLFFLLRVISLASRATPGHCTNCEESAASHHHPLQLVADRSPTTLTGSWASSNDYDDVSTGRLTTERVARGTMRCNVVSAALVDGADLEVAQMEVFRRTSQWWVTLM